MIFDSGLTHFDYSQIGSTMINSMSTHGDRPFLQSCTMNKSIEEEIQERRKRIRNQVEKEVKRLEEQREQEELAFIKKIEEELIPKIKKELTHDGEISWKPGVKGKEDVIQELLGSREFHVREFNGEYLITFE